MFVISVAVLLIFIGPSKKEKSIFQSGGAEQHKANYSFVKFFSKLK